MQIRFRSRPVRRSLLATAALLLFPLVASAGDYYIDAASGDDANGGTSPDDAWQTVTHAAASVPGGNHVLHIAPGLYDAALGEVFPVFVHGGLTLLGDEGSAVTILDGGGREAVFRVGDSSSPTRFEGMWLRNAGVGLDGPLDFDESHEMRLEHMLISDMTTHGVTGTVTTFFADVYLRVRLVDVTIRDCGAAAVELSPDTVFGDVTFADADIFCAGSVIENNGGGLIANLGSGIEAYGAVNVSASRIVHNGGTAVQGAGVSVSGSVIAFNGAGCSSAFFTGATHCTIVSNAGIGVSGGEFEEGDVQGCIVYGNGNDLANLECSDVSYSNIGDGDCDGRNGNISADPLLVDPAGGDYRLAFGSPCIDSANPASEGIDGDLDAVERRDMGAVEHAPLFVQEGPTVGGQVAFELWGPAGGGARVFVARGATVPPVATPFGELDLDPSTQRVLLNGATAPGPPAMHSFPIPDDPILAGVTFSLQALATSPSTAQRAAYTNAVTLTVTE